MKFPLRVEPDKASHGEQSCIVDAAGTVIARSPSASNYFHYYVNLSWIVEAANEAHARGISP